MSRSVLAAIGMALLLSTAGCSALPSGPDRTSTDVASRTTSTTLTVTETTGVSATPEPNPTTVATTTTEAGTATAEDRAPPDLSRGLNDQGSKLESAESYTLQYVRTLSVRGEVGPFYNRTFRVDRSAEEGLTRSRGQRQQRPNVTRVTAYRDGETRVSRWNVSGRDVEYRSLPPRDEPRNGSKLLFESLSSRLSGVDFERNGTTTVDGETVVRYSASGVEAAPPGVTDLVDYRATVLVDDGVVRSVDVQQVQSGANGANATTRIRVTLTEIGTTTVERPEWVDEARATATVRTVPSG